jgi:hypothetical protein
MQDSLHAVANNDQFPPNLGDGVSKAARSAEMCTRTGDWEDMGGCMGGEGVGALYSGGWGLAGIANRQSQGAAPIGGIRDICRATHRHPCPLLAIQASAKHLTSLINSRRQLAAVGHVLRRLYYSFYPSLQRTRLRIEPFLQPLREQRVHYVSHRPTEHFARLVVCLVSIHRAQRLPSFRAQ